MDYKDLAIKWFNKANNDLMEGNYDVTIEEARRAIDIAGKIKIFVLNKLELS